MKNREEDWYPTNGHENARIAGNRKEVSTSENAHVWVERN